LTNTSHFCKGRAVRVIEATIGNLRYLEFAVNVQNKKLIHGLPDDTIIEVPALIDLNEIQPIYIGKLSDGITCMLYTQAIIQRLSVDAAIEGDKEKALQAMLLDPVVDDFENARKCLNELLEVHSDLLPRFR